MIRFWLAFLFILGIAFASVWMADNPGRVTIRWFDWRIDTSFAFLLVAAIAAMWVMVYLFTLARDIRHMPKRFSEARQLTRYKQGLAELTYSVADLASANPAGAQKHARRAQRLLGQTPMGLLVSAQIAKNQGDEELTKRLLTEMLEYKETSGMASRLLENGAPKKTSRLYKWGSKLRGFAAH